jgi:hypothetical protein
MVPKEPQPRVEGVSLSGAMARQGGGLYHDQSIGVSSTTQRRVACSAVSCKQTDGYLHQSNMARVLAGSQHGQFTTKED